MGPTFHCGNLLKKSYARTVLHQALCLSVAQFKLNTVENNDSGVTTGKLKRSNNPIMPIYKQSLANPIKYVVERLRVICLLIQYGAQPAVGSVTVQMVCYSGHYVE